jgi:hypothetical protein
MKPGDLAAMEKWDVPALPEEDICGGNRERNIQI